MLLQFLERPACPLRHPVRRVAQDHPARAVDAPVEQRPQHALVGEDLRLVDPGEDHRIGLRGDPDRDVDLLEERQAVRREVRELRLRAEAVEVAGDLREGELDLDVFAPRSRQRRCTAFSSGWHSSPEALMSTTSPRLTPVE